MRSSSLARTTGLIAVVAVGGGAVMATGGESTAPRAAAADGSAKPTERRTIPAQVARNKALVLRFNRLAFAEDKDAEALRLVSESYVGRGCRPAVRR